MLSKNIKVRLQVGQSICLWNSYQLIEYLLFENFLCWFASNDSSV